MPYPNYWILFLFILLIQSPVFAQKKPSEKKMPMKKAKLKEGNYIQSYSKKNPFKVKERFIRIGLNEVIETGLRKNYDQRLRAFQASEFDLDFKDTKDSFWIPTLKLELSSGPHKVGDLWNGTKSNSTEKSPTGSLALRFEDYTLFNWGKDFLAYQNKKATYVRNKAKLNEERRKLRHSLILEYFKLHTIKKIEKVYREQLQKASFVYRLNREKVVLKKIPKQDYYQSRTEYLRAQSEFFDARTQTELANENMAKILSDKPGTRYILQHELIFKEIHTPINEALSLSHKFNPNVLDQKLEIENSKRSYEIQLKDNLPLPKFTVNLGALSYGFSTDTSGTSYETSAGNSNIEMVATINASWALTGKDGIFNTRKTRRSLLQTHKAMENHSKQTFYIETAIRKHYKNLLLYQTQLTILKARVENIVKTFDMILDNYISRKTRFTNFNSALKELKDVKILSLSTQYSHLKEKINLADNIGVEDFPGDNFENLAKKKEIE